MTPTASFERPAYSRYRWVVCGLLFFATTCNYLDRQVISYLKEFFCRPVALGGFGWSDTDYGHLTGFFTLFYAGAILIEITCHLLPTPAYFTG